MMPGPKVWLRELIRPETRGPYLGVMNTEVVQISSSLLAGRFLLAPGICVSDFSDERRYVIV